jgi:hypothetical protein
VILVDGALAAYLARGDRQLTTYLPDAEPERSRVGRAIARVLIDRARTGADGPRGMLLEEIDGVPPSTHAMAPWLVEAGFVSGALGLQATLARQAQGGQAQVGQTQVSQSQVGQSEGDSRTSRTDRRPSSYDKRRSVVSSPFGRRYFDEDPDA